jgi:hypothetical protein
VAATENHLTIARRQLKLAARFCFMPLAIFRSSEKITG